jgi:hypothetical protein
MLQLSLYLTFYSEEAILSYYEKDLHTYGGCVGAFVLTSATIDLNNLIAMRLKRCPIIL